MHFLEFRIILMAHQTKFQRLFGQKIRLLGSVGVMAGTASSVLNDPMDDFLGEGRLVMTLKTDGIAFRLEQRCIVGSMRVVALDTLAALQSRMHALLVQVEVLTAMAGETDLVSGFLQKELRNNTVGKVAFLTFLFLHHLVNMTFIQVLVLKIFMAIKAALAGKTSFGFTFPDAETQDHGETDSQGQTRHENSFS